MELGCVTGDYDNIFRTLGETLNFARVNIRRAGLEETKIIHEIIL